MKFSDIHAFVQVVDKGSVTDAARDLSITQSAVTKRLRRLEMSLGVTLFDRAQRPVGLTRAGQAALERCRRLLNDAKDLRAAVARGNAAPTEMSIGVAHALGEVAITGPIGGLRQDFPRLSLRLATGWSPDLLRQVQAGSLDAAIILLPEADRLPAEVLGSSIGTEQLVVLCSRRAEGSRLRAIQDLRDAKWILSPDGCGGRAALRRTLAQADLNMQVAIESYNYELQLLLTSQARGLTLVPERVLSRSPLRSRLRILEIAGLHFPFKIWSLQRRSAELDPVMSLLNSLLIEAFGMDPLQRARVN